jgi:murein DD-endopeptidase MepM/ murein hydrolase activator NlpD
MQMGSTAALPLGSSVLLVEPRPDGRSQHGAIYDLSRNAMVIFFGSDPAGTQTWSDVWVLQDANDITNPPKATWQIASQSGSVPSPVGHFATGYDPSSRRVTIFGGCCGYSNASFVGTLDFSTPSVAWTALTPSGTTAPAGDVSTFGYDPGSNKLVVLDIVPGDGTNGTWLLSDANGIGGADAWTNIIPGSTSGVPPHGFLVGSGYNPTSKILIDALNNVQNGNQVPQVWILKDADASTPFLNFPLAGITPYSTDVSAVFDHDVKPDSVTKAPLFYTFNKRVGTYTGEEGVQQCGHPPCSDQVLKNNPNLVGYKNTSDTPFLQVLNGHYTGGSCSQKSPCSHFLYYTGHAGFDYPQALGTEIIAPADGLLFIPTKSNTFREPVDKFYVMALDHGNGYASWFLHIGCTTGTKDSRCALNGGDFRGIDANGNHVCQPPNDLTTIGCPVKSGDVIGLVGNKGLGTSTLVAHLHFEVRKGITEHSGGLPTCTWPVCLPVDPYGWSGSPSPGDPYSQFLGGLPNIKLWE